MVRAPIDGLRSVSISLVHATACIAPVQIVNGETLQVAGQADPSCLRCWTTVRNETASFTVSRGDQRAQRAGRLSTRYGAWTLPSARCSKWSVVIRQFRLSSQALDLRTIQSRASESDANGPAV
jgi:hypothetical protein